MPGSTPILGPPPLLSPEPILGPELILRPELTLVTGGVDSGKTSWCLSFSAAHRDFDGVLLTKVFHRGRRIGYDALRLSTRATVPFSRLSGAEPAGWDSVEAVGPFTISRGGKEAASSWLLEALASGARGLILDEIGPLELAGGGLAVPLRRILADPAARRLILVVRRDCLPRAVAAFALGEHRLVEVDRPGGAAEQAAPVS